MTLFSIDYDEIIYRNHLLKVQNLPLSSYLKQEHFAVYSEMHFEHFRLYRCVWELKNDTLFLLQIDSNELSIKNLFALSTPLLASWFSGEILLYNEDYPIRENYLAVNINNGLVNNKQIIKGDIGSFILSFGKYKGMPITSVLSGRLEAYQKDNTIRNFMEILLAFMLDKNFNKNLYTPDFEITTEDIDLVPKLRSSHVKYLLASNFLAIGSEDSMVGLNEDDLANKLSLLLEKILTQSTSKIIKIGIGDEIARSSLLINPDFNYIIWAIKNVDAFFVPPKHLEKEYDTLILKNFNIKRLNAFVFEYSPHFSQEKFTFPDYIKKVNLEKIVKKYNVSFDSVNKRFFFDPSKKDTMEKFGYYLDESYSPTIHIEYDNFESDHINNYEKYNGYNGYTDDVIDDAYEGEPEYTWNND